MHQENYYGALSYLRSAGPSTLQLSVFGRFSRNALRPGASTGVFPTGLGGETTDNGHSVGLQAEGAFELDRHHTLRLGGVASFNRLHSRLDGIVLSNTAVLTPFTSVDKVRRDDASLFVQDEWKLSHRLTFNYGARLDHISGFVDGTAVGPRASLVWSVPLGLTMHAGYARYLVAPGLAPLGHTKALAQAGGGSLRLERDDYYDLGVQQKIGDFSLGVDGFWREADNFLSESQDGSPLFANPFNYRKARIRGVAFSATYAEGPLSAWSNFTVTQTRATGIVSGQAYFSSAVLAVIQGNWVRPDGTQRLSGSAGTTYSLGALRLSAELLYGSGQTRISRASNLAPSSLPAYVQVNLAASYHLRGLGGGPLDLRLDAINLLDRRYEISEESNVGLPQWAPRREIFVGLEQAF